LVLVIGPVAIFRPLKPCHGKLMVSTVSTW
jgi:hypothetical protein